MEKGVEKGYILEIKNFVKFNVHSPLKPSCAKIGSKKVNYTNCLILCFSNHKCLHSLFAGFKKKV